MNAQDGNLERFSNAHALLMLLAALATVTFATGIFVAVECLAVFGWLISSQRARLSRHTAPPGLANLITLVRLLVLVAVLTRLNTLPPITVFSAFALNITLDVVDGRIARARSETDPFGAQFDMEVDAVYVLTAGLYFHLAVGIGAWVLIPGLLRYAYRIAVWRIADPTFAERRRRYAAVLAGLSFTLYCAAVLLQGTMLTLALLLPTLLLCASFALSFAELFRYAARRPSVQ